MEEFKKMEVRIGTVSSTGYETSVANQDIKRMLLERETSWADVVDTNYSPNTLRSPAETFEFYSESACVVKINGYQSTIPAASKYVSSGRIYTFVTVTPDIEYWASMTF